MPESTKNIITALLFFIGIFIFGGATAHDSSQWDLWGQLEQKTLECNDGSSLMVKHKRNNGFSIEYYADLMNDPDAYSDADLTVLDESYGEIIDTEGDVVATVSIGEVVRYGKNEFLVSLYLNIGQEKIRCSLPGSPLE